MGVEAVPGAAAQTCAALAAHRAPVEDDEVAGGQVGDALADGLDDAGGLVAEEERVVVADAALLVVQVGVADAAGLDVHHRLARAGVRHHDRLDADGFVLAGCDHAAYFLGHDAAAFRRCRGGVGVPTPYDLHAFRGVGMRGVADGTMLETCPGVHL